MILTSSKRVYNLIKQGKKWKHLKAAPNFTWGELFVYRTQKDLKYLKIDHVEELQKIVTEVQKLRDGVFGGRAIRITSGWRDPVSNARSGGATRSRHLAGQGVDIDVAGLFPKQVQRMLEPLWKGGMGYGSTFTHLDIRPYFARFNY